MHWVLGNNTGAILFYDRGAASGDPGYRLLSSLAQEQKCPFVAFTLYQKCVFPRWRKRGPVQFSFIYLNFSTYNLYKSTEIYNYATNTNTNLQHNITYN